MKTRMTATESKVRNRAAARKSWRKRTGVPEPTRPAPKACESCGRVPRKNILVVDHCHSSGRFRGWLCRVCNLALGGLGDDLIGVERLRRYLRRYGHFKVHQRRATKVANR
jgi:hypothetical protein